MYIVPNSKLSKNSLKSFHDVIPTVQREIEVLEILASFPVFTPIHLHTRQEKQSDICGEFTLRLYKMLEGFLRSLEEEIFNYFSCCVTSYALSVISPICRIIV